MFKAEFDKEEELENFVFENIDKIFTEDRIFIKAKKKIITKTGKGTIPDGYLLDIENGVFYFIENELIGHDIFKHISNQIIRFIIAYNNKEAKEKLENTFIEKIKKNRDRFRKIFAKYYEIEGEIDIVEKLREILNKTPEIYIFIDEVDQDLEDLCLVLDSITTIHAIPVKKVIKDNQPTYFFDKKIQFIESEKEPLEQELAPEKYETIFSELIEEFKKKRPKSTSRGSTKDNNLSIPLGTSGFHTEWSFGGWEPNKTLNIGLHFEKNDAEKNHRAFDFFIKKKDEVQELFDEIIISEKHWYKDGKWSCIWISKDVETLNDFFKNEDLKNWAVENMVKLYDFYMKYEDQIKAIINTEE